MRELQVYAQFLPETTMSQMKSNVLHSGILSYSHLHILLFLVMSDSRKGCNGRENPPNQSCKTDTNTLF